MSIISLRCLLFALLVTVFYFIVPKKTQWMVLLSSNIIFYSFSGIRYLLYMLWTSFAAYIAAKKLEHISLLSKQIADSALAPKEKKAIRNQLQSIRKFLCAIAVLAAMSIWAVIKYGNFLTNNINAILRLFRLEWQGGQIPFVLPLGMSFYTFHAVGYLIDIFRGKYQAEKNFFRFFTFVSFFPHMIEGPFSRYDSLGASIFRPHSFSWDRLCTGSARILWGVFKKTLIADKIGISVSAIFDSYLDYSGAHILFAICAYGIQIYTDFSGYMDIVCGFSQILGIELAENFRQPYLAKSVDEFWRRWHITLGKWFRDYVFYPVSMSGTAQRLGRWARGRWGARMGKLLPGYLALFFVWTATGLWHRASWNYLVWGYLNLLAILSSMQLADWHAQVKKKIHVSSESLLWQIFCVIRTFLLVCFFRFFSRANSLHMAFSVLKQIFAKPELWRLKAPHRLLVKLGRMDVFILLIGIVTLIIVDILCESGKWESVKTRCPMPLRNLVYAGLIFAILLFSGGDNDLVKGFIYANF